MKRFQQLLVGVANHPTDDELIRYVSAVVHLGTARSVHFVHVTSGAATSAGALEQIQRRVSAQFRPGEAPVEVHCDVFEGPLEDRLLGVGLERKSDLILVGHGRGREGRKSLARRLAMKAPCSVWMVPEGSPPALNRILVPVDYSEPSADALAIGAELLRLHETGELLSLHVYFNDAVTSFEEYATVQREREEGVLRSFDNRVARLGVPIRPLVAQGADVAQAVTRAADQHKADLVIMSTRGRSRSAAVLLGSVTEDVIIAARHPLLVVKHFGAKLGLLQALLHVIEHGPSTHYN